MPLSQQPADDGVARAPMFGHPAPQPTLGWGALSAALVAAGAVLVFGFLSPWGYAGLAGGVVLGFAVSRPLGRDLGLVVLGLAIISTTSMEADISWPHFFLMGAVLAAAVAVPYAVHRLVLRDHAIRFPRRQGRPWSRLEWGWLAFVLVAAYFILPFYFIRSGTYQNWPAVESPSEIGRLLVGVNAVGIWDELFFICTVFTLLARHFPFWTANVLTSIIFVSFLWELGYRAWGPLLTIPFALVQAVIFTKTRSLPYTITAHLLFDLVVFLAIVHAHHPEWLPIFVY
ncbi:CPBP family intramembrane metalloprotease [Rothia sp. AR01]|uniref:CPBP family intramembrane metalloprotease n=1 Tax=Rothia santali TaxID=2949643 RepID=A0A9X2HEC7_9MICC|nr:CPBP family intramembrane glutamic endopeptidase [Rothia santali]MCP3426162.1 CPBP family intramembrane metalloprotease [Rothia santali]